MSASHVIVRSKLHFDGDARPMSKSTSRMTEVVSDIATQPKEEDEDTCPVPEDPTDLVQSEGIVKNVSNQIEM